MQATRATGEGAILSWAYALWFIRDILLVFCMYLMTYSIGSIVVAFLVFFFFYFYETLACAKVTVKMTFYSY